MSIDRFFTSTISVKRMAWSNESSAEVSEADFLGHIQQASPDMTKFLGETLGRAFSVWCDKDTDIEVGDTLSISTGDYAGTYSVKGLQINAVGANMHLEVVCVKAQD